MPRRAAYRCEYPACGSDAVGGRRYCRAHITPPRQRDDVAYRQRCTEEWKQLSRAFRQAYPLCCNPFRLPSHLVNVAETHHIVRLCEGGALADWENLAPLCVGCHRRIDRMELAGEDTGALFADWRARYPVEG